MAYNVLLSYQHLANIIISSQHDSMIRYDDYLSKLQKCSFITERSILKVL